MFPCIFHNPESPIISTVYECLGLWDQFRLFSDIFSFVILSKLIIIFASCIFLKFHILMFYFVHLFRILWLSAHFETIFINFFSSYSIIFVSKFSLIFQYFLLLFKTFFVIIKFKSYFYYAFFCTLCFFSSLLLSFL